MLTMTTSCMFSALFMYAAFSCVWCICMCLGEVEEKVGVEYEEEVGMEVVVEVNEGK